jgi:hypothetical protein
MTERQQAIEKASNRAADLINRYYHHVGNIPQNWR